MKFFLDTANLKEIETAASWGILDGVTTNPSLMAKEGIKLADVHAHYVKICEMVDGDISAEVIATDYEGILREGRILASLHQNIVVKVPMTRDGIRAIKTFTEEEIRTNCTLIFSPVQALIAAKAGATYVSPFVGRLDDIGHDGMQLIEEIRNIFDQYEIYTEILAASIRHTAHVVQCLQLGADVATMPFKVIEGLFRHPLTDIGLQQFLADYAKVLNHQ
ncbi:MAG: fructose-6-phosphate aldolase [Bacteroidia bacterium]|nr:fructose-6-phosphate aldolase [Bacteroidia bacterium]